MPIYCKTRSKEPELLLYIKCEGQLLEHDIGHFKDFFKKHLEEPEMIKMFVDMRTVKGAKMECIKSLVTFMNDYEDTASEKVLATSILISTPSIEKLVKLLFNFKKPRTPTRVTSKLEEACEFLN